MKPNPLIFKLIEGYGVRLQEILRVRSQCREARQVLTRIGYRLNIRKKGLQELVQELGGIGRDAVAHAHERKDK